MNTAKENFMSNNCKLPYQLIAFDLDGTFLDKKKNIPEENMRAMCEAYNRGAVIVPATGRIPEGLPEQIRNAPFYRYSITSNGAYVYDALEDKAVARAEINVAQAIEFYSFADSLPVLYDCYQDNYGLMPAAMMEHLDDYVTDPGIMRLVRGLRTPVADLKQILIDRGMPLQKMQLYFNDMELRRRMLDQLPGIFPDLNFTSSVPFNIEVNAKNATKGCALVSLCRALDIDVSRSIAFGDGTNDTDMLIKAGLGVAMENAEPEVRAAADYITLNHEAAGVASAIDKFVLI